MCVCIWLFQAADSPHVLSVPMTWVKEGGMVRLDKKYLQADYKGVSTDDIVYTILASDSRPKYGTSSYTLTSDNVSRDSVQKSLEHLHTFQVLVFHNQTD